MGWVSFQSKSLTIQKVLNPNLSFSLYLLQFAIQIQHKTPRTVKIGIWVYQFD